MGWVLRAQGGPKGCLWGDVNDGAVTLGAPRLPHLGCEESLLSNGVFLLLPVALCDPGEGSSPNAMGPAGCLPGTPGCTQPRRWLSS